MTLTSVRATESMDTRTFCTSDAILQHMYCKEDLLFFVDFYDSQESSFEIEWMTLFTLFDVNRIHVLRSMI